MSNQHKHFASSQSFAAWYTAKKQDGWRTRDGLERGWEGDGHNLSRGIKTLVSGDESNVAEARKMLNAFQERIEVLQYTWQHDVAGAFPDVPAYLAGEPENMWHMKPQTSDRTPLRVFVGLTSSAGISHDLLTKRGVTLAAFALAISARRPVYITPYVNLGNSSGRWRSGSQENALISWDIRTESLVLSQLIGCLSSPSVTRYVGIDACYAINPGTTGSWHSDYENEELMRKHLNAKPEDLYLPSIHLHDPILSDPVKWLKEKIAQYGGDE